MVKINPSSITTKFENSIDGWILPLPFYENDNYGIRAFINRENRKKNKGEMNKKVFHDIYTYTAPSLEYLVAFYMFQSFGQAYNGFFKMIQERTDFITESSHEQGTFSMEKVIESSFMGRSAFVCNQIQEKFDEIGFEFSLDHIRKKDRKKTDELILEAKKALKGVI